MPIFANTMTIRIIDAMAIILSRAGRGRGYENWST